MLLGNSDRKSGDGLKLHEKWFRLNHRKNVFSKRAQAAQSGGGVTGGIQETWGCGTERQSMGMVVWVGFGNFGGLFQHQWFYVWEEGWEKMPITGHFKR